MGSSFINKTPHQYINQVLRCMKKYALLIITLLFGIFSYAQEYMYEYNGVLEIDGESSNPTFRILFNVNANVIEGVSYFQQNDGEVTQGRIQGKYDGSRFFLYESEILPPVKPNFNYCLINMAAEISLTNLKTDFKADFVGYLNGSSSQICGRGKLLMYYDKEEEVPPTIISVDTPAPIIPNTDITPKHGDTIVIFSQGKDVNLSFIDEWPDYDRVSVYVDGKIVLNNHEITGALNGISIDCKNNPVIKVVSTSNGKKPPNTGTIIFENSLIKHAFNLNLELNEYLIFRIL